MQLDFIHDWDEASCLKIIGHCKRANPEAKVQLIEIVVPEGNVMLLAKLLDVVMLVHTEGGQERTEKEYAELFEKAGTGSSRSSLPNPRSAS